MHPWSCEVLRRLRPIGYISLIISYLILMYLYLMSFPPDQRPIKIYWTMALSAVLLPSLFVFLYLLSRDDVIWP